MTSYIALIRRAPASDFGVEFPDFPGCVTAGIDLEDARRMAAEALELQVAGMLQDGDAIPEPSSLDTIMADPHNNGTVAFLVEVAVRLPKAVRINITLPEDVLTSIDRVTRNRSRFLADAAREKLRVA